MNKEPDELGAVEGLEAQRAYIQKRTQEGRDFSLMVADAFVRGIRDLGYKSNATALDELIDNTIQASATTVHVAFGFPKAGDTKPNALAVLDDGHGMDPEMIRAAVMWGGTHREGDRSGFGRYGYGLPSACVSMGTRFSVYSWTARDKVHSVTFDVDELSAGAYQEKSGKVLVPPAVAAKLPAWVVKYFEEHFPGGLPVNGTVVMIDHLDRMKWKTAKALEDNLSEHFGLVYRNYLRQVSIGVNGRRVEPVDPLFLTAGAKFYRGDAEGLPPLDFEVKHKDSGKPAGVVKLRFAILPPAAFAETYAQGESKGLVKARQSVMADTHGLMVLRQGRQMDVVRFPREWKLSWQNNDRFVKVEMDFQPTLDEEFSVTTSKQQISLSDRMWELLREHGVLRALKEMRKRVDLELKTLKKDKQDGKREGPRPSERAMQESEKFKGRRPAANPAKTKARANEEFESFVRRRAKAAGVPAEIIRQRLAEESKERPYKVDHESLPGAPFFRVIQRGGQMVLLINDAHRFYTEVYAATEATPHIRYGLEVTLFCIGMSELDSAEDRRQFYETERNEWSRLLSVALDRLQGIHDDVTDRNDAGDSEEGDEAA